MAAPQEKTAQSIRNKASRKAESQKQADRFEAARAKELGAIEANTASLSEYKSAIDAERKAVADYTSSVADARAVMTEYENIIKLLSSNNSRNPSKEIIDFLSALFSASLAFEAVLLGVFGIFYSVYAMYSAAASPPQPVRAGICTVLRRGCRFLGGLMLLNAIPTLYPLHVLTPIGYHSSLGFLQFLSYVW